MCWGSEDKAAFQPAPALKQFPTAEDARFAQQSGFGYGSGMEPFLSGDTIRLFAPGGSPASGRGYYLDELTQPGMAASAPGGTEIGEAMTRAALAANRIPIAALGFDPRRMSLDTMTDASKVNIGGVYDPNTDHIFSIHGNDPDAASTPVHEAIHRGFEILRSSPNAVEEPPVSEEHMARYLMQSMAGDPEASGPAMAGSISLKQKNDAEKSFTGALSGEARRKMLDELNAAAAREIARRRPGGPR